MLLGGLDYVNVNDRTTEVTPAMAMAMFDIASHQCALLIADSDSFAFLHSAPYASHTSVDDATLAEGLDQVHRLIRSHPIDDDTLADADAIYRLAVDEQGLDRHSTWRAVCNFFFLKDGSFLLY